MQIDTFKLTIENLPREWRATLTNAYNELEHKLKSWQSLNCLFEEVCYFCFSFNERYEKASNLMIFIPSKLKKGIQDDTKRILLGLLMPIIKESGDKLSSLKEHLEDTDSIKNDFDNWKVKLNTWFSDAQTILFNLESEINYLKIKNYTKLITYDYKDYSTMQILGLKESAERFSQNVYQYFIHDFIQEAATDVRQFNPIALYIYHKISSHITLYNGNDIVEVRIVDYGCGDGEFLKILCSFLSYLPYKIKLYFIGLDIIDSNIILNIVNDINSNNNSIKVSFIPLNIKNQDKYKQILKEYKKKIDFVLMINTLHEIELKELPEVFNSINIFLKPQQGIFLLSETESVWSVEKNYVLWSEKELKKLFSNKTMFKLEKINKEDFFVFCAVLFLDSWDINILKKVIKSIYKNKGKNRAPDFSLIRNEVEKYIRKEKDVNKSLLKMSKQYYLFHSLFVPIHAQRQLLELEQTKLNQD